MEDQQAVRKLLAEAFGGKGAGSRGGLPGWGLQLRSNPKGKRELTGKDGTRVFLAEGRARGREP